VGKWDFRSTITPKLLGDLQLYASLYRESYDV